MSDPQITLGEGCVTAEVTATVPPVATVEAVEAGVEVIAVSTPRPPTVEIEGWSRPAVAASVAIPMPSVASFEITALPGVIVTAETPCVAEVEFGCIPGAPGPPGPQGPPGQSGTGVATYEHRQDVASATWMIVHDLGFNPNVTVIDSAGEVVEGEISYLSGVSLLLSFSGAFVGVAYLS